MKKILVTGANGFVGRHLLKVLSTKNIEIIAVVRNESSDVSGIEELQGVRIVYCDMNHISDLPHKVDERDIDSCIHLAWEGATGNRRGDYTIQIQNIQNTLALCKVVAEMNISTFIGIGTLAEKDVNNYISMDGSTPNLVANYGIAKLSAHYFTKTLCKELGIKHIWCQLSNVYGPEDKTNNFINFAIRKMLMGERAAFTTGEQMYDFVYIDDVAKAIYCVLMKGIEDRTYYVGSCHQRKLKEFIKIIRNSIDPEIELFLGEIPFNGVCLPDEEFSCKKLCEDTGYMADTEFELGVRKTIASIKEEL